MVIYRELVFGSRFCKVHAKFDRSTYFTYRFQELFDDAENSVHDGSFFTAFKIKNIHEVVTRITALTGLLVSPVLVCFMFIRLCCTKW